LELALGSGLELGLDSGLGLGVELGLGERADAAKLSLSSVAAGSVAKSG
jgi:hypothetical protein